jgi:heptaprenyl diphosphate synthase
MKKYNSKKIAFWGLLTAAALLFGYVEYLVPLNFIAPGIKLGFANVVFLLLLLNKKTTAAFFVNLIRITLSALLFASPFSLLFSLTAGIVSMLFMTLVCRLKIVGIVGISVLGATVHNLTQLCVANFTVGQGVWFYLPFLLIAGTIAGIVVGILAYLISSKVSKVFFKLDF